MRAPAIGVSSIVVVAMMAASTLGRAQPASAQRSAPSFEGTQSIAAGQPPFTMLDAPRPMPPLEFVDGRGEKLTLSDFHGRVVLLNVWATWCVPCREEMPALDRLQAKLGSSDLAVIPLSIDRRGREVVERFYAKLGLQSLGMYLDPSGDAPFALNASGMPATLLIDRAGRERGRVIGAADWDSPEMVSRIRAALGLPGTP